MFNKAWNCHTFCSCSYTECMTKIYLLQFRLFNKTIFKIRLLGPQDRWIGFFLSPIPTRQRILFITVLVSIHHVTTGLIIHLTSFIVGTNPSVVVATSATANDSFNCINSHSRWKAHSTHRITYNLSNRLQECISEFRGAEK